MISIPRGLFVACFLTLSVSLFVSCPKSGAGDSHPFRVIEILPTDGAAGISVGTTIEVTFSRRIFAPSVVNGNTFFLVETAQPGAAIPGSFTVDGTGEVLTFIPFIPLSMMTDHRVILTTGILDLGGKTLNLTRSFVPVPSVFQTGVRGDTTPPIFGGATGATGQ